MKTPALLIVATALLLGTAFAGPAQAGVAHSTVAAGGYDVVSYHSGEKPVPGNGNHLSVYEGVTYLFQNEASKARFDEDPARYVPAYGGYCAYGVAVGKKFVGDPDVWEVVDGRLYLNLDNKIKGLWSKDIAGHIRKADEKWPRIKEVAPSEL